jgi:hypothetical protein
MTDRNPIYAEEDGLGNVTNLAEFVTGDEIPSQYLGPASSVTGWTLNTDTNTITNLGTVTTVSITGGTVLDGSVSSVRGISVSGPEGVSSNDAGKAFYFKRDTDASYQNLIRAEDGTITIQAEDDVHLKSNTGEDFARFNENAAVWLYHNNSKKIETHTNGAVINGSLSATGAIAAGTAHITANTVSALSVSANTSMVVSGCPIPQPFAYIQLTSDDVASSDEKHVGYSNTPTSFVSNDADISWDDSAKNFVVKKAGTYECVARIFFEGGSTLIQLHVNVEGSPVNTADPRAHTTVDPVERTISAIFTCSADDVVDVTYEATSAQTTAAQIGTTVTIKRLK